jgi:hypothetical protein
MPLISATEVSQIAFVNSLDPALILPAFISSAENKYIVPLVTQTVVNDIAVAPGEYTILVNDYIKPYEAFCIKYMFYNQLLTETDTFPTSDAQRTAALQEVLEIMEVYRDLLSTYLNDNVFETPAVSTTQMVSGFRIGTASNAGSGSTAATGSNVTETLAGASSASLSGADHLNFIQFASGILKKITWTNFYSTLKEMIGIDQDNSYESEIPFDFNNINAGTIQSFDLDIKASNVYTILGAVLETDNGSLLNVSVNINSVPVTGLDSITVSTVLSDTSASALNTVSPGNRLTISTSVSYTGSPAVLKGKIRIRIPVKALVIDSKIDYVTKSKVESVLIGEISSHSHPASEAGLSQQQIEGLLL